jgi:hypothetical protein
VEFLEAIALWGLHRWGEWFAFVVTSAGIPYEIYELAAKVTALRLTAFLVNVALVVYLVLSKRLLGVRGGRAAYEARLRSESIMQAAIEAAAADAAPAGPSPAASGDAAPAAGPDSAPAAATSAPAPAAASAPAEAGPASPPPR